MEQLTVTVVEGGRGFNPSMGTGYQVKACSAGLAGDHQRREQLAGICTHYGRAVYDPISSAVAEVRDRELEWCSHQPQRPGAVAQHILAAFPVAWSYTLLGDDAYALVRTCYRGYCPDSKPGNFFSHAFVLRPEDLAGCGHNPLAMSRSGEFALLDHQDATVLPTLECLPACDNRPVDRSVLCHSPWQDHMPAMLTALAGDSARRPVVLCLADWRMALPLVEALLSLLPASMRARTTFSTYETDRYWTPPIDGIRPQGAVSAHQIMALCSVDDRPWNLFADDYQSKFAVFNFVGDRFSDLPPPSPFARAATDCVRQNQSERLGRLHAIIERLALGRSPASWDSLVDACDLLTPGSEIAGFQAAVRSLAHVAQRPAQAVEAVSVLLPWVAELAQAGKRQDLALVHEVLGEIARRLEPGVCNLLHEHLRDVFFSAESAVESGRGGVGQELKGELKDLAAMSDPVKDEAARSEGKGRSPRPGLSQTLRRMWEAFTAGEEDGPRASESRDNAEKKP